MAAPNLLAAKILVGVGWSFIAVGLCLWVWGIVGMPWNEGLSEAVSWALSAVMLGSLVGVDCWEVEPEWKDTFRWVRWAGGAGLAFSAANTTANALTDGPASDYLRLGSMLGIGSYFVLRLTPPVLRK